MSKETEEKQIEAADQRLEEIESTLSRTEKFLEENQNAIMIGGIAIIVVFAIIALAKALYFEPLKEDAQKEIFYAQYYFEADSFKLALNGDGINKGFLDVIDEYSSTPAGKLAQYYAGVCYMKLGEYENAKNQFKSYSSDDEILNSMAKGLMGDAEVELGNLNEATSCYKKAISDKNKLTAPIFLMKLGNIYEKQGDTKNATSAYEQIKDEYPTSVLASAAEKNLESIKK